MPNADEVLCAALIATAKINKVIANWMLLNTKDLTALRDAVKGLDPTFVETYNRKRDEEEKNSRFVPVVAQLQESLDATIQSLEEIQRILAK